MNGREDPKSLERLKEELRATLKQELKLELLQELHIQDNKIIRKHIRDRVDEIMRERVKREG